LLDEALGNFGGRQVLPTYGVYNTVCPRDQNGKSGLR
jgi:hypothetical protein